MMRGQPRNRYSPNTTQDRPKPLSTNSAERGNLPYQDDKNHVRSHPIFSLDYHIYFLLRGRVTAVTFVVGMAIVSCLLFMSTPMASSTIEALLSVDDDSFMKDSLTRADFFASKRQFFGLMKTTLLSKTLQVTDSEYDLSEVLPPLPRGGRQLTAMQSYLQPLSVSATASLKDMTPLKSSGHYETYPMNEKWMFHLVLPAESTDISTASLRDAMTKSSWQQVSLPHSWNSVDTVSGYSAKGPHDDRCLYFRGVGWYRSQIDIGNIFNRVAWVENLDRLWLYVDRAAYVAHVVVNDTISLGYHTGGYLPFVLEIPSFAVTSGRLDEELLRISLGVTNAHNASLIPSDKNDYFLYGGLTGHIQIGRTGPIRIVHSFIDTTLVSGDTMGLAGAKIHLTVLVDSTVNLLDYNAVLALEVSQRESENSIFRTEYPLSKIILDLDNINAKHSEISWRAAMQVAGNSSSIASSGKLSHHQVSFPLPGPISLWSTSSPNLYNMTLVIRYKRDREMVESHLMQVNFGIRSFDFPLSNNTKPFTLNGNALKLAGTSRHDDFAGTGSAVEDEQVLEEMISIKSMGFNFLRLAHYPQRRIVLDACDDLGIVAWEELPWSRGGVGGAEWKSETEKQLVEMIVWHYNHPSVIFWGLGNEIDVVQQDRQSAKRRELVDDENANSTLVDAVSFLKHLNIVAKSVDSSRLTIYRSYSGPGCPDCSQVVDVYSPSIWMGWYSGGGYKGYEKKLKEAMNNFPRMIHAEWGGSSHVGRFCPNHGVLFEGGKHIPFSNVLSAGAKGTWSETYMAELVRWTLMVQMNSTLAGMIQWSYKDFGTPQRPENPVPCINMKGIRDRKMAPKEIAYSFQAILTNKPVCHIEGDPTWKFRQKSSSGEDILRVVHNCEHVTLYLNESMIGSEYLSMTIPPPQYKGKNLNPYMREWTYDLPLGTSRIRVICDGCGLGYVEDRNRMMGKPLRITRYNKNASITNTWAGNRTVDTSMEQIVVPYQNPNSLDDRLKQVDGQDKLLLAVKQQKVYLAGSIEVYRISVQLSDRSYTPLVDCREKNRRVLFSLEDALVPIHHKASHSSNATQWSSHISLSSSSYELMAYQGTMGGSVAVELANGGAFVYALPIHQTYTNIAREKSVSKSHGSKSKSQSSNIPPGMTLKNRVRVWLKDHPHVRGETIF